MSNLRLFSQLQKGVNDRADCIAMVGLVDHIHVHLFLYLHFCLNKHFCLDLSSFQLLIAVNVCHFHFCLIEF